MESARDFRPAEIPVWPRVELPALARAARQRRAPAGPGRQKQSPIDLFAQGMVSRPQATAA